MKLVSVLSRNNKLSIKKLSLVKKQGFMKKLNKNKIKWIVREMKKREMGWHVLLYNIRMNIKFEANASGSSQAKISYFFVMVVFF